MSEYANVELRELVRAPISYGVVQPGALCPDGIPIIRVKDVRDGRIAVNEPLRIDPAVEEKHRRTRLDGGEVVMSLVGTVGECAVVSSSTVGWNVARAIAVLRPRVDIDPRWLALALTDRSVRMQIDGVLNTTVQSTLNLADLQRISLRVPNQDTRIKIVEALGALDDKIEANRKLAATADDLSRWRFKEMQASPESEPAPLSSTARFVNGRAFTKDASGTGRVVVRIAELNSGLNGATVRNDIEVADEHIARPGDLLFAWSGSLTLARWFREEAIVNQHIFKVIPSDGCPLWLVRQFVQDQLSEFQAIAADKATTMGHIQRRHLDQPVLVPAGAAIESADEEMDALWRRALIAEMESESLTRLRDTLLPKLLSGQLRVEEAMEVAAL